MKKFMLIVAVTALAFVGLNSGTASAWTYGLSGSGNCQPDGSFKIIWKIDNTKENQALNVTYSSNTAVVPVGTQVPKKQTANYPQVVSGNQAGSFTLTLKANWPGDRTERTKTSTVNLNEKCAQPVTPPASTPQVGGQGGGPVVLPAQVQAPVGAVNTGLGNMNGETVAIAGLVGSLVAVALGIRQLRRN